MGAALLNRAREAGVVRRDLDDDDLVPLMCGTAFAVTVHAGAASDRGATAHRYLAMLPGGPHKAPDGR